MIKDAIQGCIASLRKHDEPLSLGFEREFNRRC